MTAPQILYQVPQGPPLSLLQQIQPTPEQQAHANQMVQQQLAANGGIPNMGGGMRHTYPQGAPRGPYGGGYMGHGQHSPQRGPVPSPHHHQHQGMAPMLPTGQGMGAGMAPVQYPPPGGYFGGMYSTAHPNPGGGYGNPQPPMMAPLQHIPPASQNGTMHHTSFATSYSPRTEAALASLPYGVEGGGAPYGAVENETSPHGGEGLKRKDLEERDNEELLAKRPRSDSGGSKGSLDVVSHAWAPPLPGGASPRQSPRLQPAWQPPSPMLCTDPEHS
jgi:hypothetical protein